KPILYANPKYEQVGSEGAKRDIAQCESMAQAAGATPDQGRAGQTAKGAAVGAGAGAAAGAGGGAIWGDPGTGAPAGRGRGAGGRGGGGGERRGRQPAVDALRELGDADATERAVQELRQPVPRRSGLPADGVEVALRWASPGRSPTFAWSSSRIFAARSPDGFSPTSAPTSSRSSRRAGIPIACGRHSRATGPRPTARCPFS